MPSPTSRGYPYPADADAADVPADLEALAEAVNDDVQAVLDGLVAHVLVKIEGAAGGYLKLADLSAGLNLKRSNIYTDDGKTYISAVNDADSAYTHTFLTFDHATGDITFPAGSIEGAALANGAVTAAKVAADVATQAELDGAAAALLSDISGVQSDVNDEAVARAAADAILQTARGVRGRVNPDGTIAQGAGFTVNKVGTGVYDITFTAAFSAVPHLSLTTFNDDIATVAGSPAPTTSTFRVMTNADGAGAADLPFFLEAKPF